MSKNLSLPDEEVINKIYQVKGMKIMLDRDLAELYGVTTGNLNKAVMRNIKRFPVDFMFQLTFLEFDKMKYKLEADGWGGTRKLPLAFTEQGVAMLSGVLNSNRAIKVNIQIMRVFTRMREMIMTQKDIMMKLEVLEKNLLKNNQRLNKHDEDITLIFDYLKKLLNPPKQKRKMIGFKMKVEK